MTHSPFPWSIHPQVPHGVYDADGMKVAVAVSMTAEEDAALIAAIPEMIEALQKIGGDREYSAADIASHAQKPHKTIDESVAEDVLVSIGKKP